MIDYHMPLGVIEPLGIHDSITKWVKGGHRLPYNPLPPLEID